MKQTKKLSLVILFIAMHVSVFSAQANDSDQAPRITNCRDFRGVGQVLAESKGDAAQQQNLTVQICMDDNKLQAALRNHRQTCIQLQKKGEGQQMAIVNFETRKDENGIALIYSFEYRKAYADRSRLVKTHRELLSSYNNNKCEAPKRIQVDGCNKLVDQINGIKEQVGEIDKLLNRLELQQKDKDPKYIESISSKGQTELEIEKCFDEVADVSKDVFAQNYDQIIVRRSAGGTSGADAAKVKTLPRSLSIQFDSPRNQKIWFEDTQNPGTDQQYTRVSAFYLFPRSVKPKVTEAEIDGHLKTVISLGDEEIVFDNKTGAIEPDGAFQEFALGSCPPGREITKRTIRVMKTSKSGKSVRMPVHLEDCGAAVEYQGSALSMDLHGVSTDPVLSAKNVRISNIANISPDMAGAFCVASTDIFFERSSPSGSPGPAKEARFRFDEDADVFAEVGKICGKAALRRAVPPDPLPRETSPVGTLKKSPAQTSGRK